MKNTIKCLLLSNLVYATQVAQHPEYPKFLEVREEVNNKEAELMPLFDEINDTLLETNIEEMKKKKDKKIDKNKTKPDKYKIPLTPAEATCFARRYP